MGSRPPRQQPLPKNSRRVQLASSEPRNETGGLRMETITPLLGFGAFPIAIGASFIGFAATSDTRTIGAALVVTLVVSAGIWVLARSQSEWRRTARMTNELLMALLVAAIGLMLAIGGIAALSAPWIVAGAAVLAGAWLIQRISLNSPR